MDWGVVAAVIVGNVLSIFVIILMIALIAGLVISGVKKKARVVKQAIQGEQASEAPTGVTRHCSITVCPMNKVVDNR